MGKLFRDRGQDPPLPLPESYKNWKGKFFRVCSAKHDPTTLDGFPLYWTERPKLLRAKTLEELSPADREVSKALAGLGIVFDTLKLVRG